MNLHNSVFTGMLKHGVETGAVRDDIPFELLFGIMNAMHDVFDTWIMDHIDELTEEKLKLLIDFYFDMYKSIAEKRNIPQKEESHS